MRRVIWAVVALGAVWACGGVTAGQGAGADGGGSSGSDGGSSSGSSSGSSGSGSGSGSGSSGGSSSGSGGSSSSGSGSGSGGSSGGSSSGADGGQRVPVNHRTSDAQCSQPASPGQCMITGDPPPPDQCTSDADCADAGVNGRCVESSGGAAIVCRCTSDTCVHDTDCPSQQVCSCHGAPYSGGAGNTCMPGNCRVDSDCGAGGFCSPSYGTALCGSLGGYYCHTATDSCVDDIDCASPGGPGAQVCAYSSSDGRWECVQEVACP
jgi:hypothetical protein